MNLKDFQKVADVGTIVGGAEGECATDPPAGLVKGGLRRLLYKGLGIFREHQAGRGFVWHS
jgi:hypothetical protein